MSLLQTKHLIMIITITGFVMFSSVICQSTDPTSVSVEEVTENTSTTPKPPPETTHAPPKNTSCEQHNKDCKNCLENSQCFYCEANEKCQYKKRELWPEGECQLKKSYYWTCKISYQALMILIGVLAGIIFLIFTVICCYCCCKKKGIKISKDDLKWARQREERKQIAAEKRKERAERTEKIRQKYALGVVKDSNPYQRFDA